MSSQNTNRPPVRVKQQGCVRNLPDVNIGTWNVRTLNGDRKLDHLLNEMSRLKIDILGVSETHWNADMPQSFEHKNHVVICSSRQDEIHRQGVAIIMTKDFAEGLVDYNVISERIISVTFDTATGHLVIFQIYAPDSSYSEIVVDKFYEDLPNEINMLLYHKRTII